MFNLLRAGFSFLAHKRRDIREIIVFLNSAVLKGLRQREPLVVVGDERRFQAGESCLGSAYRQLLEHYGARIYQQDTRTGEDDEPHVDDNNGAPLFADDIIVDNDVRAVAMGPVGSETRTSYAPRRCSSSRGEEWSEPGLLSPSLPSPIATIAAAFTLPRGEASRADHGGSGSSVDNIRGSSQVLLPPPSSSGGAATTDRPQFSEPLIEGAVLDTGGDYYDEPARAVGTSAAAPAAPALLALPTTPTAVNNPVRDSTRAAPSSPGPTTPPNNSTNNGAVERNNSGGGGGGDDSEGLGDIDEKRPPRNGDSPPRPILSGPAATEVIATVGGERGVGSCAVATRAKLGGAGTKRRGESGLSIGHSRHDGGEGGEAPEEEEEEGEPPPDDAAEAAAREGDEKPLGAERDGPGTALPAREAAAALGEVGAAEAALEAGDAPLAAAAAVAPEAAAEGPWSANRYRPGARRRTGTDRMGEIRTGGMFTTWPSFDKKV